MRLQNFCTIDEIAKEVGGFDFILAGLGVSSMQIDNPKRGFSFKVDGPLDLRLNQETGISAAERLDTITREELAGMLYENSDEPYCEELAKAITDEIRRGSHIDTTTKLRRVIEDTLDFLPEKEKKDTIKKTCQRTFQALRIDVNQEFEVLYEFMEKLPGALRPGGRVAILTFHSGEDKLVKQALKEDIRVVFTVTMRRTSSVRRRRSAPRMEGRVPQNALGSQGVKKENISQVLFLRGRSDYVYSSNLSDEGFLFWKNTGL